MEGEAEESQRLGRVVEHGVEPWLVFRLLGEGPGRTLVDVLIADLDKAPDGFQGPVELQTPEVPLDCRQDLDGCPLQLLVQIGLHRFLRFRHDASGEPLDHGQAAVQEVAEIVRQVRIDPADQGLSGKISVLTERHLTQQEIAERIHAEFVHDGVRVYHISPALGHLFAVRRPPAVGEDGLWQRQLQSHEYRGPVHSVRRQDVFADEVDAGRPVPVEGDRKSTRLNSSHGYISYAVFCLKKKKKTTNYS